MTQTADATRVIEKIKKLLALAEHEATGAAEAATAAAKAQALLEQYNLDRAQLEGAVQSSQIVMHTIVMTDRRKWAKSIMTVLCEYNFCRFMFSTGSTAAWIIGEPTNVEVVLELGRSLSEQVGTMADASYALFRRTRSYGDPYASAATYKTNFYNGAVDAINQRLSYQREAFKRQQAEEAAVTNTNRALAVIDQHQAAITAFMQQTLRIQPKNVKLQSRTANYEGYSEGVEAGNTVALHKLLK